MPPTAAPRRSSTRRPARRSPRCRRAPRPTSTAPSRRPRRRSAGVARHDPGERAELLLKLADVIDEHAEELAELESQNVGKPLGGRARTRCRSARDNIRFFAGAARMPRGPLGGRVHARLHVDDPPRADRDRRPDRAVELPADDGGLEVRARARRGQRLGPQAVGADAALDAPLRAARGRRDPARRPQRDHRRRRARRRRHRPPPGRRAWSP